MPRRSLSRCQIGLDLFERGETVLVMVVGRHASSPREGGPMTTTSHGMTAPISHLRRRRRLPLATHGNHSTLQAPIRGPGTRPAREQRTGHPMVPDTPPNPRRRGAAPAASLVVPLASLRVIHHHPNGSGAGGSGYRRTDPVVHPLSAVGDRTDHGRPARRSSAPSSPPPAVDRAHHGSPHLVAPQARDPVAPPQVAPPIADPADRDRGRRNPIPKIGLSMVVVEGTGVAQLQAGPGHYPATPLPGESGQRGHRRSPDHLPPPLLQPQRSGPR